MRALVTGGGGFLGGAIVDRLLARGSEVCSVSRSRYPALEHKGVPSLELDLGTGGHALEEILVSRSIDTVFHCAAKPGIVGPRADFEHANVRATEEVIRAAQESTATERLVFTSSPSVVFDGKSHRNAGPNLPYPAKFLAHYPRTKARAERLVLISNQTGLATIALRPHLIFGPGDPNLVPRLLDRRDKGRLRVVGDGHAEVSLTYVENAAEAHVVASDALMELGSTAPCAGQAYFVNNVVPVKLWEWIDQVLVGTGRAPVTKRIPAALAYGVGAALEGTYRALRLTGEPPMTRFVAKQLATSHSYDMAPFIRDTGGRYAEPVDLEEATQRTIEWARRTFPPNHPPETK